MATEAVTKSTSQRGLLRDLLNKNKYQRDTGTVILCATAERHFTVLKSQLHLLRHYNPVMFSVNT